MVLIALLFITGLSGRALADNATILKEIQTMKERIEELEQKLEEQESLAKRQAAKTEKNIEEKIGEALEERFGTLEIHGGALLYYQDSRTDELDGAKADSPSGAGFTVDLELTWKPALPLIEDGKFYARIHAGDGTGADRGGQPNNPVNVLLANLNTIADDNTGGNNTGLNLLEAHYTHEFFDNTLSITGGKAKNLLFLDGNAFANNDKKQFVGKPFVNNSVLDSESEYTPLIGGEFKPSELLAFSVLATSTSRPNVEGTPLENTAKSRYDNVFSTPFLGSQVTVSPKFGELEGNYRLYGWYAGYNHSKLDSDRNPIDGEKTKGWGLGISADQQITEMIGLFGRFGWKLQVPRFGIFPERIGEREGMGRRLDTAGVDLPELVHVVENVSDLHGEFVDRRLVDLQPRKVSDVQDFVLGDFHNCGKISIKITLGLRFNV